jgi:hypothetical protein
MPSAYRNLVLQNTGGLFEANIKPSSMERNQDLMEILIWLPVKLELLF